MEPCKTCKFLVDDLCRRNSPRPMVAYPGHIHPYDDPYVEWPWVGSEGDGCGDHVHKETDESPLSEIICKVCSSVMQLTGDQIICGKCEPKRSALVDQCRCCGTFMEMDAAGMIICPNQCN